LKKRRPVALFHTLKERLQNPVIIFDIGLFSSGFKTVLIKLPA
jgi:hypothetical protein